APPATETGPATAAAAQPQAKKAPIAPLAVPSPAIPPPTPVPAAAAAQPGLGGPVMGQVTAIGQDPSTFTILTPSGDQLTYRVLDTTVFTAGRDRPYNFGLLKIGDEVRLRGRATPPAAMAQQSGQPAPGRELGAGQGAASSEAGSQPAALFVIVRPAGEQRAGLLGHASPAAHGLRKGAGSALNQ